MKTETMRMNMAACCACAVCVMSMLIAHTAHAQHTPAKKKGAHVMVPIKGEALDDLALSNRELSGAVKQIRRAVEQRPSTIDEVLRSTGKKDPARILDWVRANVSHEPYQGALRAPEIVLVTGSANAVDAARLMYALLDAAKLDPRYAWGELKEDDARVLLLKFGELVQFEQAGEVKELEPVFASELMRAVRDHMWVEVPMRGGELRALDVFASADALNSPAKRTGGGKSLPERYAATFKMAVVVTFEDGREESFVPVSGAIDEFAHRTLTISLERDDHLSHTTRPVLTRGLEVITGDYFPHGDIRQMALKFELTTGGYQQLWTQSLYEKGRSVDVFAAEQLHVGVTLLPGWTSRELVANQGVKGFDAALAKLGVLVKEQQRVAKEGERKPLSEAEYNEQTRALMDDVARALPYMFVRRLDRVTHAIGDLMGVSPVIARPRLVITAMVRDGAQLFVDADMQGDSLGGMSASGLPLAVTQGFVTLSSRMESEVRAMVLDALATESTLTTGELMKRARKQKIEVVTISSADTSSGKKLKVDKSLVSRLARRVKRVGKVVFTPVDDVAISERERFGWWEIDPASGWVMAKLAHGLLNKPLEIDEASKQVDQGTGFITLGKLLGKQIAVWLDALDESQRFDSAVCATQRDLIHMSERLCVTDSSTNTLPSLDACLSGKVLAEQAGFDAGGAAMGDPLGGVGLERATCASLSRPARCGAVIASAFLSGEVRVLRGNALGEFSPSPDALMCK